MLPNTEHTAAHAAASLPSLGFPEFSDEVFGFLTRLRASVVQGCDVHISFLKVDVTGEQKTTS